MEGYAMGERKRVFSGSPYEDHFGYCRAIRIGNRIEVSGTTSMVNGELVGVGDVYQQTLTTMNTIQKAIEELGGSKTDIVRLRLYITERAHVPDLMRAAQDFGLKDILPTASLLIVNGLIDPRMLVEIEADAMVDE
jgi:enamine deaminase RidA (YjgF/YER057c/UK114 family)